MKELNTKFHAAVFVHAKRNPELLTPRTFGDSRITTIDDIRFLIITLAKP